MIFQNTDTQTVILSARKCGLITLGATVTKEYKNYSGKFENLNKSLDPWIEDPDLIAGGQIPHYPIFDKTAWADWNVILFIRDPYQRYLSGLATLWMICWKGDQVEVNIPNTSGQYRNIDYYLENNFKDWFETALSKTQSFDLNNGHLKPFLHKTVDMQYKTLQVYKAEQLSEWLVNNGFKDKRENKTLQVKSKIIKDYMEEHYKEQILTLLQQEQIYYNNLLDKTL